MRDTLERALELGGRAREAFVDSACGGDAALRAEVERLLAQAGDDDGALEPRPHGALRALAAEQPSALPAGACVGPYVIEELLGSGGMGSVYRAARTGDFRQRVALKVIRPGMASEDVLRRFRQERALLAELEHPGIARLIDGGTTVEGRPYLVVELVEGVPIDRWCDERRLDVRARIELFLEVCAAVEHAHQRLVLHRDLKPGNVLVGADGRPKLLDFGVAKVLSGGAEGALELTRTGTRLYTPRYASPEQALGLPMATASDVYSLGVILYELLTGARPYEFETESPSEIARVLREVEPRAPSAILAERRAGWVPEGDVARLRRRLTGDLDTIVLTALRKEPERRYASVAALADDLRRHLSELPIAARPDTLRYRWAKFVRRNRAGVLAASVTCAALVTALVVSLFQYAQATRAAAREREQRGLAQARSEDALLERDRARWHAYVADVAAAEAAIRAHDVADARRRLELAPEALRGWEWRHLRRRLDRSARVIETQHEVIYGLAFRPGGGLVATAGSEGGVRLWRTADGALAEIVAQEQGPVTSVAFSPDGELLAWCGVGGILRYRDVEGIGAVLSLDDLRGVVRDVVFAPDASFVACVAGDEVAVSDLPDGSRRHSFRIDGTKPTCATLDAEGARLAAGYHDGMIRCWRLGDGVELARLRGHAGPVRFLSFADDGEHLASGSSDNTARLWELGGAREVRTFFGHESIVDGGLFLPDGRLLTASWDRTIRAWDVATGRPDALFLGHRGNVTSLAIDAAEALIASGENGGALRLWMLDTRDVRAIPTAAWRTQLGFTADGELVAGDVGTVRVLDPVTGQELERLSGPTAPGLPRVALSLRGSLVACASESTSEVELWRMDRPRELLGTLSHDALVGSVALSDDGTRVAAGGYDGSLAVWSTDGRERLLALAGDGDPASRIAFRPGAPELAAGTLGGRVRVFSLADGSVRVERALDTELVFDLCFSPDGLSLAVACSDATVRLLDPATLAERARLSGHGRAATCVTFTPDGTRLASGAEDYSIKLWDPGRREEVATLHGHGFTVRALAFDPTGAVLASQASDGTFRIWDAAPLPAQLGEAPLSALSERR